MSDLDGRSYLETYNQEPSFFKSLTSLMSTTSPVPPNEYRDFSDDKPVLLSKGFRYLTAAQLFGTMLGYGFVASGINEIVTHNNSKEGVLWILGGLAAKTITSGLDYFFKEENLEIFK